MDPDNELWYFVPKFPQASKGERLTKWRWPVEQGRLLRLNLETCIYNFDYHIGPATTIKDKSQSPQAPHFKNCFATDVRDKYSMTVRTLKQMDLKEHGDLIESYGLELADLVVKPTLKKEFKARLITQHFIPRMINARVKKIPPVHDTKFFIQACYRDWRSVESSVSQTIKKSCYSGSRVINENDFKSWNLSFQLELEMPFFRIANDILE